MAKKAIKAPTTVEPMSSDQYDRLINAVERISVGTMKDPMGLEAVTMALSGDPRENPSVAKALVQIADALNRIADALTPPRSR